MNIEVRCLWPTADVELSFKDLPIYIEDAVKPTVREVKEVAIQLNVIEAKNIIDQLSLAVNKATTYDKEVEEYFVKTYFNNRSDVDSNKL